jgi:hypothetical protein
MSALTTAWMLGCVAGFFMGAAVASRRRPTCHELMPPLKLQRTVRLDEGHVQRGNRSGASYQPKPQIDPKGQRRTSNPPPSEP